MTIKNYALAILVLFILTQILCIALIETFIALNIGSSINIEIWRYVLISFFGLTIFVVPILIRKIVSKKKEEKRNIQYKINKALEIAFDESKSGLIIVNKKNNVLWLNNEAKKLFKSESKSNNVFKIDDNFRRAFENPGINFNFSKNNKKFMLTFNKELNFYICKSISGELQLKEIINNNEEVFGFLEIRNITGKALEIPNEEIEKLKDQINEWALKNKIVATLLENLNFVLNMRRTNMMLLKKEDFSVIKKLEKTLFNLNKNLIIQLSLATAGKTSLENAIVARKGLIDVRSNKNYSLVILQDLKSEIPIQIFNMNGLGDNYYRETGVIPEGVTFMNYEKNKSSSLNEIPISIKQTLNEQKKELNSKENNEVPGEGKKEIPPWLKKVIDEKKENMEQLEKKIEQKSFSNYSLLGQISLMKQTICYLNNGNNKDEFLCAFLIFLITKGLDLSFYCYSETSFQIHHSLKSKLNSLGQEKFTQSFLDAYNLKRLNKNDSFYLIIQLDAFNREMIDTIATHKIAFLKDSLTKDLLENLMDNIKTDLKSFKFSSEELETIKFLANRVLKKRAQHVITFFNNLEQNKKDE